MIRIHDNVVVFLLVATSVLGEKCNLSDLSKQQCPENQACQEVIEKSSNGTCVCLPGFRRLTDKDLCVKQETDANKEAGTNITAVVLSSLIFITLITIAIYYGRKYRFMNWLRYKIKRHISNYDDVMIGQDDD